jgi:hypothetical protein
MMEQTSDYDSPWKEILENYFREFLQFFFPVIEAGINWSAGYEFLDKELQQIMPDADIGRCLVDKLVKVWRIGGEEIWVLIHIEVQGQVDPHFERRMYIYNYRLFDRYNHAVCSLAVLADERQKWRPRKFHYDIWGCKVTLEFPTVKLLDYRKRLPELETSSNPFAIVVLAHLKMLETRKYPQERLQWKFTLAKTLYKRGFSRQDILELLRFIDWVMTLPAELEQQFRGAINQFEEESKMQYVTTFERAGIEQGMQQGIQQGMQQGMRQGMLTMSREDVLEILRVRFGKLPTSVTAAVNVINDLPLLKELHKQAATIDSMAHFQQLLPSPKS